MSALVLLELSSNDRDVEAQMSGLRVWTRTFKEAEDWLQRLQIKLHSCVMTRWL